MNLQEIKTFCEENNYTSRSSRYEIMEKYFNIGAGTCKDIVNMDRMLRWVFPADSVGIEKEKLYHTPNPLFELQNRTEYDMKKLQKDRDKFV